MYATDQSVSGHPTERPQRDEQNAQELKEASRHQTEYVIEITIAQIRSPGEEDEGCNTKCRTSKNMRGRDL